jgi:lysophospholipase L1-like esterase
MTTMSPRLPRGRTLAIGAAASALAVGMIAPAFASSHASRGMSAKAAAPAAKPAVSGAPYLALGDSVPFGYKESTAIPKPNYHKPKTLLSWPQDVASALGLKLTNASCPGETTASLINVKAQSNGCENTPAAAGKGKKPVPGGYRTLYPLHAKYANAKQSQLAFAEAFLNKHPTTRLVTLMVGANDGFICEETTADTCVSEIGAVQKTVTKNVSTILKGLRVKGHYNGQIVISNYYSTNYTSLLGTAGSEEINAALTSAAKKYDAKIANTFAAFKTAAATHKGDTCGAGLLTNLKVASGAPQSCGVHLSPAGAAVLAGAVEKVVKK